MEGFVTQLHFQIMITEAKYEFNTTYQDFLLRKEKKIQNIVRLTEMLMNFK